MKNLIFALSCLGLAGCGRPTTKFEPGCSIKRVQGGTQVTCTGSSTFIPDATDGADGDDGLNGRDGSDGEDGSSSIVEIIDPCGDNPNQFDEVLIRLSSGELLGYFEQGSTRFLVSLTPGEYRTTDRQRCEFTVTEDLEVIDETN